MMAFHNKRTDEETRMSNPNWMMTSMADGQNEARHDSRILQRCPHTIRVKFQSQYYIIWLAVRAHMSSPESKFLEEMGNKEQYSGQWIAILGAQVVANGRSITDVYAKAAKSAKGKTPLFVEIPDKNKEQTLIL